MSFSGSFRFPHTITVEPFSANTVAGGASYGTAVTIAAQWVKGTRMFRLGDQQELKAQAEVYAPADDVEIGPKDRVTLPDGTTPPILGMPAVFNATDGSKVQHVVFG